MRNERMLAEFIELVQTDSASRKETLVANKLIQKLSDLGFEIRRDNVGQTFGGECDNVLGILKGEILRIPDTPGLKIPHMGWNSLHLQNGGRLFAGIGADPYVYFVHSYYLCAEDPSIVKATTEYGVTIHASVEQGNVFACQYHPEKSSEYGLAMLKNFAEL